jgi:hypothetical protein
MIKTLCLAMNLEYPVHVAACSGHLILNQVGQKQEAFSRPSDPRRHDDINLLNELKEKFIRAWQQKQFLTRKSSGTDIKKQASICSYKKNARSMP